MAAGFFDRIFSRSPRNRREQFFQCIDDVKQYQRGFLKDFYPECGKSVDEAEVTAFALAVTAIGWEQAFSRPSDNEELRELEVSVLQKSKPTTANTLDTTFRLVRYRQRRGQYSGLFAAIRNELGSKIASNEEPQSMKLVRLFTALTCRAFRIPDFGTDVAFLRVLEFPDIIEKQLLQHMQRQG